MTNALLTSTNTVVSNINGLEVVKQVNDFYSAAFDRAFGQIIWLLGILIGFLGIIVPLVYYFLQKRQLALKEQILTQRLQKEVEQLSESLSKTSKSFFEAERISITEKFNKLEAELQIKSSEAEASVFHLQGNMESGKGHFTAALRSYCSATKHYVKSGNLKCVQQMLGALKEFVLPKLKKTDFDDPEITSRLNKVLSEAENIQCQKLLDTRIEEVKKALAAAQKRDS